MICEGSSWVEAVRWMREAGQARAVGPTWVRRRAWLMAQWWEIWPEGVRGCSFVDGDLTGATCGATRTRRRACCLRVARVPTTPSS